LGGDGEAITGFLGRACGGKLGLVARSTTVGKAGSTVRVLRSTVGDRGRRKERGVGVVMRIVLTIGVRAITIVRMGSIVVARTISRAAIVTGAVAFTRLTARASIAIVA
jgi:hypothetical protein